MGNWFSSNNETTKKEEGENLISNNVTVTNESPLNIHNTEILILLYIITAIKLTEFIYFVYKRHIEKQRKKFTSNSTKGNPV